MLFYVNDNGITRQFQYVLYNYSTNPTDNDYTKVLSDQLNLQQNTWQHVEINNIYNDMKAFMGKKIIRVVLSLSGHQNSGDGIANATVQLDNFTISKYGTSYLGTNGYYSKTILPPVGTDVVGIDTVDPDTGFEVKNSTIVQVGPMHVNILSPINGSTLNSDTFDLNLSTGSSKMNHVVIYVDGKLYETKDFNLNNFYNEEMTLSSGKHTIKVNVSNGITSAQNETTFNIFYGNLVMKYYINNIEKGNVENVSIYKLGLHAENDTGGFVPNLILCLNSTNNLISSKGISYTITCLDENLLGDVSMFVIPISRVSLSYYGSSFMHGIQGMLKSINIFENNQLKNPPSKVECNYKLNSTEAGLISNTLQKYKSDLVTAINLGNKGYIINVNENSISSQNYYGGVPTMLNFSLPVGYSVKIVGVNMLTLTTLQSLGNTSLNIDIANNPEGISLIPTSPPAGVSGYIKIYIYNSTGTLVKEYTLTYKEGIQTNTNNFDLSQITNILQTYKGISAYSINYLNKCKR